VETASKQRIEVILVPPILCESCGFFPLGQELMIRPAGGTPGDHKDQNQAIGWIWQDGYERDWLSAG